METTNKKIVIAVVVYDRIGNFIKWLKLAKILKSFYAVLDLEIRIIQNVNRLEDSTNFRNIAANFPVSFEVRYNRGLDIGVFQDVCNERLEGFGNDFDYLIWFTDDCFPTSIFFLNDFLSEFLNPFQVNEKMAMTCMEVSTEIRPHARTTAFCVKKEILSKIVFPVPTITTKNDCYTFEHGQNNFYLQLKRLGLEVKQIEKDIFFNLDSKRIKKYGHEKARKDLYRLLYNNEEPNVLVFATAYNRYPQIISSVFCQYHHNNKLEIWHDGKLNVITEKFFGEYLEMDESKNILKFREIGEIAQGNYGHHLKKQFLETFDDSESEYLVITNEDNYISPYFLQKAIEVLEQFPDKVAAYCSGMVHNYKPDVTAKPQTWREKKAMQDNHIVDGYGLIPCRIERGFIDIGALVIRSSVAKSISWGDFSHSSDWDYIENISKAFGGKDKFISFPGIHFVHN